MFARDYPCSFVTPKGTICEAVFSESSQLDQHMESFHTNDYITINNKQYKISQYFFKLNYDITLHYYECPYTWCKKKGTSLLSITEHAILKHDYNKKSNIRKEVKKKHIKICKICWITCYSENALQNHFSTKSHCKKETYTLGTGCDLCHIIGNFNEESHKGSKHEYLERKRNNIINEFPWIIGIRKKSARK